MLIYENKDKDTKVSKIKKNEFLFIVPYDKPRKTKEKRKIFWVNFPWNKLKIIKKETEKEIRKITISAEYIQTLDELLKKQKTLEYDTVVTLFTELGNQIKTLENFGLITLPFTPKDILVVDNHFFIIEDGLNKKTTTKTVSIKQPQIITKMKQNKLIAPEIKEIDAIPAKIHMNSSYYNLASLAIYCLFKKHITNSDDPSEIEEVLQNIFETKLYWGLKRCLISNREKRQFLMI